MRDGPRVRLPLPPGWARRPRLRSSSRATCCGSHREQMRTPCARRRRPSRTTTACRRAGRDEGGSRTLWESAGGCTKKLGAAEVPKGQCGRRLECSFSCSPALFTRVAPHEEPCTKIAWAGTCSFLLISKKRCAFYSFIHIHLLQYNGGLSHIVQRTQNCGGREKASGAGWRQAGQKDGQS